MADRWLLIQGCMATSWAPKWGDPDVLGVALQGLYILVAITAVLIAARAPFPALTRDRERMFWIFASLVLIALCLNKQLDLQVFVSGVGRCVARAEGWFKDRRLVQRDVTFAFFCAAVVVMIALGILLRGTLRRNALVLFGLFSLLCFVTLRVVSAHHVDKMLGQTLHNVKVHRIVETGALLLLLASEALILLRRPPDRS